MINNYLTSHCLNDEKAIQSFLKLYQYTPKTQKTYNEALDKFIVFLNYTKLTLQDFTNSTLTHYKNFLFNPPKNLIGSTTHRHKPNWKPFKKDQLSDATIKLNFIVVNLFLKFCKDDGYINHQIKLIKNSEQSNKKIKSQEKYLTKEQFKIVIQFIEQMQQITELERLKYHRTRWVFYLVYLTGLRATEITNLTTSNIVRIHGRWWIEVTGKGNKLAYIPIVSQLFKELITYRTANGLTTFPDFNEKTPLVHYLHNTKKSIQYNQLQLIIKQTCQLLAYQLKKIDPNNAMHIANTSIHWLRHTYATHSAEAGLDLRIIKENMRHSSIATTLRYIHTQAHYQHIITTTKFQKIRLADATSNLRSDELQKAIILNWYFTY